MKGERITLDTNILVYAIDRNADRRHEFAAFLVDAATETDCVLTLQALSGCIRRSSKRSFRAGEYTIGVPLRNQTATCPRTVPITWTLDGLTPKKASAIHGYTLPKETRS